VRASLDAPRAPRDAPRVCRASPSAARDALPSVDHAAGSRGRAVLDARACKQTAPTSDSDSDLRPPTSDLRLPTSDFRLGLRLRLGPPTRTPDSESVIGLRSRHSVSVFGRQFERWLARRGLLPGPI
jgi:hypothetical protein